MKYVYVLSIEYTGIYWLYLCVTLYTNCLQLRVLKSVDTENRKPFQISIRLFVYLILTYFESFIFYKHKIRSIFGLISVCFATYVFLVQNFQKILVCWLTCLISVIYIYFLTIKLHNLVNCNENCLRISYVLTFLHSILKSNGKVQI